MDIGTHTAAAAAAAATATGLQLYTAPARATATATAIAGRHAAERQAARSSRRWSACRQRNAECLVSPRSAAKHGQTGQGPAGKILQGQNFCRISAAAGADCTACQLVSTLELRPLLVSACKERFSLHICLDAHVTGSPTTYMYRLVRMEQLSVLLMRSPL